MPEEKELNPHTKLSNLTDEELEKIIIEGSDIHIPTSKSATARRVLDMRRQKRQAEAAKNLEDVSLQLRDSHKELVSVVGGLGEIAKIFNFFRMHWLPEKTLGVRLLAFVFGTVIVGISINLLSDYIGKIWFGW